jgi:CHAT domain-containing protein/tetratricopeptide (TPR) repeat protein
MPRPRHARRALLPALALALLASVDRPADGDASSPARAAGAASGSAPAAGSVSAPARASDPALKQRYDRVIAMGDSLVALDRQADALALVLPVLAQARAVRDSSLQLSLVMFQGSLLNGLQRMREAEPVLREGLALAGALRDTTRMCNALDNLAFAADALGRKDDAIAQLTRLRALAQQGRLPAKAIWARMGLARQAMRSGDHAAAKTELQATLDELATVDNPHYKASALNLLAICHKSLGEWNAAMACWRSCLDVARKAKDQRVAATALTNLATMEYYLGDPDSALRHQLEILTDLRARGQWDTVVTAGSNVITMQTLLRQYDAAEALAGELLQLSQERGLLDKQCLVLNVLGMLRMDQDRNAEAASAFRQSLALQGSKPVDFEMEAATGLSQALAKMDSTTAALAFLQQKDRELRPRLSVEVGHTLDHVLADRLLDAGRYDQALQTLQRLDRAGRETGRSLYQVSCLARAGRCFRALGQPDSARAYLRRAARVWEAERSVPLDPQWREQRGEDARLVDTDLADLLLQAGGAPTASTTTASTTTASAATASAPAGASPARASLRDAFEVLQRFKARTLQERMLGPGAVATAFSPVALDTLQQRVLQPGEVFLDFYLGPRTSLLLVITADSCLVARLPGEELELARRVRLCHELMATPPAAGGAGAPMQATLVEAGRQLSELLLGPAAGLLRGARRVVYSPDGVLNVIPLEALCGAPDGGGACAPLLQEGEVFRVPSATLLAKLRAARRPPQRGAILALTGRAEPSGSSLPGAQREVRALASSFAGVERRDAGSKAAATALAPAALAGYGVLHLAAHTVVDDRYPWRSAILLASNDAAPAEAGRRAAPQDAPAPSRNGGQQLQAPPREGVIAPGDEAAAQSGAPGALYAADIAVQKLSARLAVLSACESAAGRVVSGEGVQGLSSAFLSAGVPAVIGTLWPVDDAATARLMQVFYDDLGNGHRPAAALRRAQLVLRSAAATAQPYYWAGFVLVGDGDVTVELHRRPNIPLSLLVVGVMLLSGRLLVVVTRWWSAKRNAAA